MRRMRVHADRQLLYCGRLAALCNAAPSVRKHIASSRATKLLSSPRYKNDLVLNITGHFKHAASRTSISTLGICATREARGGANVTSRPVSKGRYGQR